jgi:hypothetical protein
MAKQVLAVQHYDAPAHTALPVKQFFTAKNMSMDTHPP